MTWDYDKITDGNVNYAVINDYKEDINLTNIAIPNNVDDIPVKSIKCKNSYEYLFIKCKDLNSVTIQNDITSIESNVFYNCSKLSSVTIPNTVYCNQYRR